jgi:hypothetical protein
MKAISKKSMFKAFLAILFLGGMASCGNQDEGTARVVVRMTDSPGDYEEVNVEILDIQVNSSDGPGESGWRSLGNINAGIYNLLELTNGTETVLTSTNYPTGFISQIRLILGNNNSVKIGGETIPLVTPSAQQTGIKLLLNQRLESGVTYAILLDFDAAQSVVKTGANTYVLKPVVKVVSEALDGAIEGEVLPAEVSAALFAIDGLDTLASSFVPSGSSMFFLGGLPAGTFTLSVDPGENSGYTGVVIEGIEVSLGQVTNVGQIELEQE